MSTSVTMPRSTRPGSSTPPTKRLTIADITSKGSGLPNRYLLHAVEKFGKTSTLANAPKPIFIQSRGETGLEPLIDAGVIPETAHFPECESWQEVNAAVDFLINEEHDFKTLVMDTINGIERLCHELVCARDFAGDWGEKGFSSFGKGPLVALADWTGFLAKLDTLRTKRKMTIFMLCHTKVQTFRNPLSNDYDRYQPDVHKDTWSKTSRWVDVILFGNFETTVAVGKRDAGSPDKKGKGTGGSQRIIYTQRTAAYDAGNRLDLPEEIEMGNSAKEGWAALYGAIISARKQSQTSPQPEQQNTQEAKS